MPWRPSAVNSCVRSISMACSNSCPRALRYLAFDDRSRCQWLVASQLPEGQAPLQARSRICCETGFPWASHEMVSLTVSALASCVAPLINPASQHWWPGSSTSRRPNPWSSPRTP